MGETIVNRPLKTETRYADLWFKLSQNADRTHLGLLGELLTRDSLIEVFRNPATDLEIRNSQSKLTADEIQQTNKAKQNVKNKLLLRTNCPFTQSSRSCRRAKTGHR